MSETTRPSPIITPEAVALNLDYAGAGSRLIAAIYDGLVLAGIALVVVLGGLGLAAAGVPGEGLVVAGVVVATLLTFGYFPLLEGLWNGKTIGKKRANIRVINDDGTPVTWRSVVVRNLLRLIDQLLGVGFICIILTRRSQRLGDLAAGTVVVHDETLPLPSMLNLPADPTRDRIAESIDVSLLSPKEVAMVRSFLVRRVSLDAANRASLASAIVATVGPKVGYEGESIPIEALLEAVHLATRKRGELPPG